MQTDSSGICNDVITPSLTMAQSPHLYRIKWLPVEIFMPDAFTEIQQMYILSKDKCEQIWRVG